MKQLIFSILFLLVGSLAVDAQSTSPRFGTATNQDNTGRVLTYKYLTLTDAAGADSLTIRPAAYHTVYRVDLADSLFLKSPSVADSYAGDQVTIVASGASGDLLKFAGTNFITAGTATLSTSARAIIHLVFDGSKWVEASRVVQ